MTITNIQALFILIVSAIFLQLFGHYFATKFMVYDGFLALWPILRILLPSLLLIFLAIPFKALHFKLPTFDRTSLLVIGFCCLGLLGLAMYLANFAEQYLSVYRRGVSIEVLRETARFERFLIFTLSTLIAWEVFHRGFLLGSLRHVLTQKLRIEPQVSNAIAMLFVVCFEALFHIKKPMYESMPLVFASLILSWLTIRTGSLWPALFIHLAIEIIFGYSAYVGWG